VSVGIDTWGVDYVLLDGEDKEIGEVYCYRDARTEKVTDLVHEKIPFEVLYEKTGIQFGTINTIYQLYSDKLSGKLDEAKTMLMLPDYFNYKLTGQKRHESTIASTTGMINTKTHTWDEEIIEALGFNKELFEPLSMPGTTVGEFTDEVAEFVGYKAKITLPATHDTGSAVVAAPLLEAAPYISSGTWSLLGIEKKDATTTETARVANYSNEGGVNYNRYQMNITGMWIVQNLKSELCPDASFGDIVKLAETSDFEETFDVNDGMFNAPESMKSAIDAYLFGHGKALPKENADYFKTAYKSLACCYAEAIADMERNTGMQYKEIYIVGGGAKNDYLNKLTEKHTGKRVIALPIEATAVGNLKTQMKRKA
jgi:rhamnulokinase